MIINIEKSIYLRRTALLLSVVLMCLYPDYAWSSVDSNRADSAFSMTQEKRENLAARFLQTVGQKLEIMKRDTSYLENDTVFSNRLNFKARLASMPEDEELILLVSTDQVILSEALLAINKNNTLYLSLFEFFSALDFPININLDSQTASGWFISEDKEFYLDITQAFVEADGRKYTIRENDVINDGIDLLVSYEKLAQWFDIQLDVDLEMLAINVESDIPLPVEAQMLRDKRASEFEYVSRRPVLPYKKDPYRLITEPFADIQLGASFSKAPDQETTNLGRYSIIAANDLGYMNAKTYIQGTSEERLQDIRLTLNRKAEEGEDFGILGIDEVSLGDVTPTRLAIVDDSGQERGIRFSSNIGDNDVSDTIQFQGDVQPGWDVELYRNDILVAIQQIDSSGRYDFQNVELFFGENDFRLVFYGPQGQIREETESIPIFGSRLAKGETAYDVSLTQRDKVTYRANELSTADSGTPALVSRYEYGLTDDILGFVGTRAWERDNKAELLGVAGIQTSRNNFLYTLNTAHETGGGSAVEAIAQGLIGKNTLRLRQQFATDDFDADVNDVPDISETEARFQGRLGKKTGYTLQGLYNVRSNDDQRFEASANLGTNLRRMNLNNQLSYIHEDSLLDQDQVTGASSFSGVYNGTHWRSRVNYDLTPETDINSFLVSGLRSINTNLSAELELENFVETDVTEGRLSMNYRNDNLIFTPRISYDSDQELTAFMTMNFGLGRDPYSDKSIMTRNRMTNTGAVSARAFLDENANGFYDPNEELLEGVSVISKTDAKRSKTDKTGRAFLTGLREDKLTDITVDREKFSDPFWISTYDGHSIIPRAGVVQRVDFPIAVAGEVDGMINIVGRNEQSRPARQMVVELMNANREVIQTQKTAYDGFYLFQDVPPGRYIVNIPQGETDIRGLKPLAQNHFVDIEPKGTVETGIDFTLYSDALSEAQIAQLQQKNNTVSSDYVMVLRLGQYNSSLLRILKWVRLKRTYPEIFAHLRAQFADQDRDKKFLDIGPFYSANHANAVCEQIVEIEEKCSIRRAVRKSSIDVALAHH